ncbi:ATP-binding protein [Nocardia xishanensis]
MRELLAQLPPAVLADAVQVFDELVSNACRHRAAPRRCQVSLHRGRARLRIEVDDAGPGAPWLRTADGGQLWERKEIIGCQKQPSTCMDRERWETLGDVGNLRKRCADFMTDKTYPSVDLHRGVPPPSTNCSRAATG